MTSSKKSRKLYCFDTSAFVMLSRTSETIIQLPEKLWAHLEKMMKKGVIISHTIVFDEISSGTKNPDFITKWIADKKDSFLKKTDFQIQKVSQIVKKFPKLIDIAQEHEQADPWVIALALEKCEEKTLFEECECVVVSHENPKSSIKIPAVCKDFGIRHLSLKEFFNEIGLSAYITHS
ncbi:MAG: DUF4411 family protein [Patescibacteria group bacterium]